MAKMDFITTVTFVDNLKKENETMTQSGRGGWRGGGRPALPEDKKLKTKSIRLNDLEYFRVKMYIKELRTKENESMKKFVNSLCDVYDPSYDYGDVKNIIIDTKEKFLSVMFTGEVDIILQCNNRNCKKQFNSTKLHNAVCPHCGSTDNDFWADTNNQDFKRRMVLLAWLLPDKWEASPVKDLNSSWATEPAGGWLVNERFVIAPLYYMFTQAEWDDFKISWENI